MTIMTICTNKISFARSARHFLISAFLMFSYASFAHADLYITDDYLKGLDAEVKSEKAEDSQSSSTPAQETTTADINKAMQSRFNFENLLRTKHKTSFVIYTKLSTSDRILIYDEFKTSRNIAKAKQMIINKFESR